MAFSILVLPTEGFSKDICRSMVAMLDKDHSGMLGFEEFKKLLTDLASWRVRKKNYFVKFKKKIYLCSLSRPYSKGT